jgi:hypothetical protein
MQCIVADIPTIQAFSSLPIALRIFLCPANELASDFFEGDRAGSELGAETRSCPIKKGAQEREQRDMLITWIDEEIGQKELFVSRMQCMPWSI